MHTFILQTVVIVSLAFIIILLSRAVPRVNDDEEKTPVSVFNRRFDHLFKKLPLSEIDSILNSFFEKILRKIKLVIMKIDNLINIYIARFKKNGKASGGENQNQPAQTVFEDFSSKDKPRS